MENYVDIQICNLYEDDSINSIDDNFEYSDTELEIMMR